MAGAACVAVLALRGRVAAAQTSTPAPAPTAAPAAPGQRDDDDAKKASARIEFEAGKKAFEQGDYAAAARHFERAYELLPLVALLYNRAVAQEKLGELATAANLYARFLRESPEGTSRRSEATEALQRLKARLGLIEWHATDVTDVCIDGAPAAQGGVFVIPGTHAVTAASAQGPVRVSVHVEAGDVVGVELRPPPPADFDRDGVPDAVDPCPDRPGPQAGARRGCPEAPPRARKQRPSWLLPAVYAGGAATLVMGALDGLAAWHTNDLCHSTACDSSVSSGVFWRSATNVMFFAAIGLGVTTLGLATFALVRSGDAQDPALGLRVGPGGLSLVGSN
jgi:hypothetical protein